MLSGVCGACALALHTGTPCAPCSCVAGEISTTVEEADARSQVLERRVSAEADRARRWRYVWTAINGFSTAAPLAAIPFVSRDVRTDLVVGSVSSAVSTGFTVFWPLEVEGASERLAMASGLGPCARLQVSSAEAASAADDESQAACLALACGQFRGFCRARRRFGLRVPPPFGWSHHRRVRVRRRRSAAFDPTGRTRRRNIAARQRLAFATDGVGLREGKGIRRGGSVPGTIPLTCENGQMTKRRIFCATICVGWLVLPGELRAAAQARGPPEFELKTRPSKRPSLTRLRS